ncbi:MAG: ABC transporter ATP-binding protein [Burkholderiales bacterium]|nr:ABC transporter ATP-binding protein [Burkholderiales bacterium]
MSAALLEFTDVVRHFADPSMMPGRRRVARALDGVGLRIAPGESVGLVGESGCGKSTLARLALLLDAPTSGRIAFAGRDVGGFDAAARAEFRRRVQAVFQDPTSSLSPRMRLQEIIAEPLRAQGVRAAARLDAAVAEALTAVGLATDMARRYPHELSGGQRQRVAIARAIVARPDLVILDEPISSLDVSVRAQILNLLAELKAARGTAYLFIAHDLLAVASLADRIAVMYLGRIVEEGDAQAVSAAPLHPYTRLLFASAAMEDGAAASEGEPPSAYAPPSGCRFHPRCPLAQARCANEVPLLREVGGRRVACHFVPAGHGL